MLNAAGAPNLSLGSTYALAGQTVSLEMKLAGATAPCAGVNAKIILPPGVTLVGLEKGGLLAPGDFATDFQVFSGGGTIIAYSGTDTFSGGDGVLLRLRLAIAPSIAAGKYPITFATANPNIGVNSRYALSDATGNRSLPVTASNGELFVDADGNHNGMGDTWEFKYFTDLTHDGNGDYDGDGVKDRDCHRNQSVADLLGLKTQPVLYRLCLREYRFGLDPSDAGKR